MIDQKNKRLLKDINEVGCLFLCLANMTEELFSYQFEPEQLNAVWEMAVKRGYIVNRETKDPDGILKMLKEVTKTESEKRIFQIGQTLNGFTQYWGWVKDKHKERIFTMAMEKTGGTIGTHFILVKSYAEPVITYDSWTLSRAGQKTNTQRFIYYGVV